jgi:hypothetical protein
MTGNTGPTALGKRCSILLSYRADLAKPAAVVRRPISSAFLTVRSFRRKPRGAREPALLAAAVWALFALGRARN